MTESGSRELREGLLGKLNIEHLHFVQCYRHIKLFPIAPARVGFSWAMATHGSIRLSRNKAIAHLNSNFTPSIGVSEDIGILEKLPESSEVVIRRALAPHLRANLTWPDHIKAMRTIDPEIKKQYPGQINAPLPLFIQLDPGKTLPDFNQIKSWHPDMRQARLKRSDARLIPLSNRPGCLIFLPG